MLFVWINSHYKWSQLARILLTSFAHGQIFLRASQILEPFVEHTNSGKMVGMQQPLNCVYSGSVERQCPERPLSPYTHFLKICPVHYFFDSCGCSFVVGAHYLVLILEAFSSREFCFCSGHDVHVNSFGSASQ